MDHFFTFFSMSLIFLVVPLILELVRARAALSHDKDIMKYHRFIPISGAFGFIMFIALGLWALLQLLQGGYISNIVAGIVLIVVVFSIFCPASLWLFIRGLNWKLILDKEQLIYRNMWGRVKRIDYQDITGIKTCYAKNSDIVEKYIIYFGTKKIVIDYLVTNFNAFPQTMNKRLNKFKNKIKIE